MTIIRKFSETSFEQRKQIYEGLLKGLSKAEICRTYKINSASLYRELSWFKDKDLDYDPILSQKWADERRKKKGPHKYVYSEEKIEQITRDLSIGMALNVIKQKHHVSMHALKKMAKLVEINPSIQERLEALEETVKLLSELIREKKS